MILFGQSLDLKYTYSNINSLKADWVMFLNLAALTSKIWKVREEPASYLLLIITYCSLILELLSLQPPVVTGMLGNSWWPVLTHCVPFRIQHCVWSSEFCDYWNSSGYRAKLILHCLKYDSHFASCRYNYRHFIILFFSTV